MSTPKIIFLDTNIFEKNQFDFASTEFIALLTAFPEGTLTLLLPDPTARELYRHIRERADAAGRALKKARKEVPFVARLSIWPDKAALADSLNALTESIKEQLDAFLAKLSVQRLDYSGITFPHIMDWYDEGRAPFSDSKPKEFPDALAMAALLEYAGKNRRHIAVISFDKGMKDACSGQVNLTHYPSISSYLDASLGSEPKIEKLKAVVQKEGIPGVAKFIEDGFPELGFYHFDDDDAGIQDVSVKSVELDQFRILHVGDSECLFIVNATVSYSALVTMDDPDTMVHDSSEGVHFALHRFHGTVDDSADVKLAVKCKIAKDWSSIESIDTIKFITDLIQVTERPTEPDAGWEQNSDDL